MMTGWPGDLRPQPRQGLDKWHGTQAVRDPEHEPVICGLSVGYEDTDAPANKLRTDRAPLSDFTRFIGYER